MEKYEELFSKVLDTLKLSDKEYERIANIVNELVSMLYREFKAYIDSRDDIFIGGSFSRKTVLKDDFDVDIFIRFPTKYDVKDLSRIVIKASEKLLGNESIRLRYAEHPYVEAIYKGVSFNIVPAFKVEPPNWRSAVDRTYYHTVYLDKYFRESYVDEVILLKSFLKGIGCYGAEVTSKGFSGYLTELLIIKYGGFLELIRDVAGRWRPPVIVEGDGYTIRELKILFPNASMIYLDPIDNKRNVASAVSEVTLSRFISASKAFLSSPRLEYFYPFSKKALTDHINRVKMDDIVRLPILIIYLRHGPEIEDIFYSQLEKFMRKLARQMEVYGADLLKMEAFSNFEDKSVILYLLSSRWLSELVKHIGPLVHIKSEHDFLLKNRDVSIMWIGEGRRWYKSTPSKFREVKDVARYIIDNKLTSIPSHIRNAEIEIYYINEFPYIIDKEINIWLRKFVAGVEFWRSWF